MPPDLCQLGEIPNYQVLTFVRSGGSGDVWLARERLTGVLRAIKTVPKSAAGAAAREIAGVRRYQRYAGNHPHLLQILTVGENEQCFYYVMEAADNAAGPKRRVLDDSRFGAPLEHSEPREYRATTLRTRMRAHSRWNAREALDLVYKLALGVQSLHAQGLAHFDLKPENVLIVDGAPRIADMGLVARLEEPPSRTGTPSYMTPQGRPDDLYALGKILYELLTSQSPHEFPRLPPALLRNARPELTAALKIMNRACHTDAGQRFRDADELVSALSAARGRPTDPLARWRQASVAGKLSVLVTLALLATVTGLAVHDLTRTRDMQFAPTAPAVRVIYAADIPLSVQHLRLARANPASDSSPAPCAYLRLGDTALPPTGLFAVALEKPLRNFVVDYHIRSGWPWGAVTFGVAQESNGSGGIAVALKGQPEGLGLRLLCATVNENARLREPPESILGHPQPGLTYVLRLARGPNDLIAALWPLACESSEPLIAHVPLPRGGSVARFLTIEASAATPQDEIELLGVHVADYSAPLPHVDEFLPALVADNTAAQRVIPACVPRLFSSPLQVAENLLSGPWHPFASRAWTPLGNWCWWPGASPSPDEKPIRCTPFSTDERQIHSQDHFYDGNQYLRFEGAEFGDFSAVVRIRLGYRDGSMEHTPFTCVSHNGAVGLAVRLQTTPPPRAVYGGGYLVGLHFAPEGTAAPGVTLGRFNGLCLDGAFLKSCAAGGVELTNTVVAGSADEIGLPQVFALRVVATGPRFQIFLDDRLVADATDPAPDYFRAGRIALYASRLMATFESVEVTPLP